MERIGFSTGSLARGDVDLAMRMLRHHSCDAVELSALRVHELLPLVRSLPRLDLSGYAHVSVHAPSAFSAAEEGEVARLLLPLARRGWLVVLHPDAILDSSQWRAFGDRLCIENMDRRKPGRTVAELEPVFAALPQASFCLDVAHTRQCDPSMEECRRLLDAYGQRLAEVHMSELDEEGRHVRLSYVGIAAFQEISERIDPSVPVIIEAPVAEVDLQFEMVAASAALGRVPVPC